MVVFYHGMPLNSVEGIAANVWYEEGDGTKVDLQTKITTIINSIEQEKLDRQLAVRAEIENRTVAVEAEAQARTAAVSEEANARSQGDASLAQSIESEAVARANADTAESTARQSAITAETEARNQADSALQDLINNKVKNNGTNVTSINFTLSGNSLRITTS